MDPTGVQPLVPLQDQGLLQQTPQISHQVAVDTPNTFGVKEGSPAVPAAQLDADMLGSNGQIVVRKPAEDPDLIKSDTAATSTAMSPMHASCQRIPALAAQVGSLVGSGQQSLPDMQAQQAALPTVWNLHAYIGQMQAQLAAKAHQLTAQYECAQGGQVLTTATPQVGNNSNNTELQARQSSNMHGQSAPAHVDQHIPSALRAKEAMAPQGSKALSSANQLPAKEVMPAQLCMTGSLHMQHQTRDSADPAQHPDDLAGTSSPPSYDLPLASGTERPPSQNRKDSTAEDSSMVQMPSKTNDAQQEQLHWGGKKKRKRAAGRTPSRQPEAADSVWLYPQTTPATEEQRQAYVSPSLETSEELDRTSLKTSSRMLGPAPPPLQHPALFRRSSQALDATRDCTEAASRAKGTADLSHDVQMAEVYHAAAPLQTLAAVDEALEGQAGGHTYTTKAPAFQSGLLQLLLYLRI